MSDIIHPKPKEAPKKIAMQQSAQDNCCSVHLRITGRVQGVGYRAWCKVQARERGLNGWIRNCSDGSVEAVLSGDTEAVEHMVQACHDGPIFAAVMLVKAQAINEKVADGFMLRASV